MSIRIQPDSVQVAKDFELPVNDGEAVVRLLLESGLFAYLRQRPLRCGTHTGRSTSRHLRQCVLFHAFGS